MFSIQEVLIAAVIAGVLSGLALVIWHWARARGRFAIAGLTTTVGFIVWNLTLNATNATGFNVDAPIIALSAQDVGSGILAFFVTALVLGFFTESKEPSGRVVGAAAIAGLAAMVFDIFVL